MPSAEQEAYAAAEAAPRDVEGRVDLDVYMAEYQRRLAERHERLMSDARAVFRAMDGWQRVRDADTWQATVRKAAEDLETGGFLIDRLGGERYLDPELIAALLVLRRKLIDEYRAESGADLMLIDLAVMSYYHALRISGWMGNFAILVEAEFFGKQGLSATFTDRYGRHNDRIRGLRVEDHVERIGEELLPLLDRCNRMLIRNLTALQARRQAPGPSVSIGQAGQVNVASQQLNTTGANDRMEQVHRS